MNKNFPTAPTKLGPPPAPVREDDLDRNGKIRTKDRHGKSLDRAGQGRANQGRQGGYQGASLVIHGFQHGRPQWREIAESQFAGIPSDKQPTTAELKEAFAKAIADGTPERGRRLAKLRYRLQFFDARQALHTTSQSTCDHFPNTSLSRHDPGLVMGQHHAKPFDDTDAILAVLDVMLDTGRGRGKSHEEPKSYSDLANGPKRHVSPDETDHELITALNLATLPPLPA